MKKSFYIFRHGETDYNLNKIWQGQKCDAELNQKGISQAEELANMLADKSIEVVFSSPLKRADKTAEILAARINKPKFVIDSLKEACLGEFEGMHKDYVLEHHTESVEAWYDEICLDACFPKGETKAEVAERFLMILNRLACEETFNVFAISTHSAMIRCLCLYLGFPIGKVKNAGVYNVVYEDETWSLVS